MKRKILNIDPVILYKMFGMGETNVSGYSVIDNKITSSDPEDGGADHDYVIQDTATGEFYMGSYSDWDIDNTDYDEGDDVIGNRNDFNTQLTQVFPRQVTITVYE